MECHEEIKSDKRFLAMCAKQELVVGNSWFKKNDVYYINTRDSEFWNEGW